MEVVHPSPAPPFETVPAMFALLRRFGAGLLFSY
jgi:hypothetical protein